MSVRTFSPHAPHGPQPPTALPRPVQLSPAPRAPPALGPRAERHPGIVRFVFFPTVPSDQIDISLKMPQGTPWQQTHAYALRIEEAAPREIPAILERIAL